jgi:hypothetical protein
MFVLLTCLVFYGWLCRFRIDITINSLLINGACAHIRPPSSWALNVPCPLVYHVLATLVLPIAHLFYHVSNLVSTPSPMQTTHLPLVPLFILINHTSPISSHYQPLTLHFPKPLWSCTCKTFSPFHFTNPSNCTWSNPPTYPHFLNTFATSI